MSAFGFPKRPAGEPRTSYQSVEAWGMTHRADARVFHPTDVTQVKSSFEAARRDGVTIGPRGSGCSYGDASVNTGGHTLDITGMDKILSFDNETGIADCEAGVTIEGLWKHSLPRGYWPTVVSGTMFPTLAGTLGANIHGKNNFRVGTIGDAVHEFDLVTPAGELLTCSRDSNSDVFHAAIGGFGLLGVFTRVKIKTKKVHSGNLEVAAHATENLAEMMRYFEEHKATSDYLVGWIDCFGKGKMLGRGLIHNARYLDPGEDQGDIEESFTLGHQELPENIMGLFPKGELWQFLKYFTNDPG
ncbi:MAG: decaprenylphospho-beta-D-ribofuranose 2-oxidase, partial [Planctomycetota bacterium]